MKILSLFCCLSSSRAELPFGTMCAGPTARSDP